MEMVLENQDLDMQNGNKPFAAIWMVTYNHEFFIEQAVESVMMQKTSFDYKLFIGEDCSTDNTKFQCKSLKEKYPDKIELFLNEKNLGGSLNAKQIYFACIQSGAKYMALLEGDDYWTDPLKLQKQIDFLEANEDYGICFHRVKVFIENEKKLVDDYITREVQSTSDINELVKDNFIHTPSVVLRNNFDLPDWHSKSPLGDWALYIIAIKESKIMKLDSVMAVYRVSETGVWSSLSKIQKMENAYKSFKLVYENIKLNYAERIILEKKINKLKIDISSYKKSLSFTYKVKLMLNKFWTKFYPKPK